MKHDKRTREQMRRLCGEICSDDGIDPREFFGEQGTSRKPNRKLRQLCKQVSETLDLVLSGEFNDDILIHLRVVSVDPAPDASQLAVTVSADPPGGRVDCERIMRRLKEVSGRLRCEVAAAISRKRAPKLLFHVVGPQGKPEDDE